MASDNNQSMRSLLCALFAATVVGGCAVQPNTSEGEQWTPPDEPTAAGELPPPTGAILWEHYDGFPNGLIEEVRQSESFFAVQPSRTYLMTSLDLPRNLYDNFTMRLRGYLRPAVSGNYRIYVRGTMAGGVWLSTDESLANARLIAKFDKTTTLAWDGFPSQKSEPLYLESGKSYYFEALQKNGVGSDHFLVGWAEASAPTKSIAIIKGDVLAPFFEKEKVDPALITDAYILGYRVGYTDGRYSFPVDMSYPAKDSDGDGLPDNWEIAQGLNPQDDTDATSDADGDGLYALLEFQNLSDARKLDTDGDGIPDGWEVANGLSPLNATDASTLTAAGITYLAQYSADAGLPPPLKRGEALVKWAPPSAREDGSSLPSEEIAGYEIQYGPALESMTKTLRIEDGNSSWVVLSGLDPGLVYVSVLAYDTKGRLSSPSEPMSLAVAE